MTFRIQAFGLNVYRIWGLSWLLPTLSNSWIISIKWSYIALSRTPDIDCYWVGAVPKV